MSKLLLAIASLALAVPMGAQAQDSVDTAEDNYNMVIIYGDDECPESTDDQIVVCARKAENERYRIPENLRFSDSPENQSWAERVERFEIRFGEIIAAERAKRLATIDEDAAAEQERVEMIEREYMERLERERAAEVPGEEALPQPESAAEPR